MYEVPKPWWILEAGLVATGQNSKTIPGCLWQLCLLWWGTGNFLKEGNSYTQYSTSNDISMMEYHKSLEATAPICVLCLFIFPHAFACVLVLFFSEILLCSPRWPWTHSGLSAVHWDHRCVLSAWLLTYILLKQYEQCIRRYQLKPQNTVLFSKPVWTWGSIHVSRNIWEDWQSPIRQVAG